MKLLIFGPPGSGKGTHSSRLKSKLSIPVISTGNIFRKAIKDNTELGKKIKNYLDSGRLVPDEITIEVLKDRISKPDCEKGFILDGFPRTIAQAEALSKIADFDAIINLMVPKEIIVERLSSRRTCKDCGEIYNLIVLKPKQEDICDKCGGKLFQREDDKTRVIEERFRVYEKQTAPLLKYYEKKVPFINIMCASADAPPEEMTKQIIGGLKKLKLIN